MPVTDCSHRDPDAEEAASTLRRFGYDVEVLPPASDQQRCDLLARLGSEITLLEVKTWGLSEDKTRRLARGEPVEFGGPVRRHLKSHTKLSDAASQLSRTSLAETTTLRMIWMTVQAPGADFWIRATFCTLYGVRFLQILDGPCRQGVNIIPCYLAERSWFQQNPEIDAVVVQPPGQIGLWMNPFSTRAEAVVGSRLGSVLNASRVVFHLPVYRAALGLYVADATSEAEMIANLKRDERITVRPAPPEATRATSTAWPGNERGHSPMIPGADLGIPLWDLFYRLHVERTARIVTSAAPIPADARSEPREAL